MTVKLYDLTLSMTCATTPTVHVQQVQRARKYKLESRRLCHVGPPSHTIVQ